MKTNQLSIGSCCAALAVTVTAGMLTSVSTFANELELSINEELIDLRFTSEYEKNFAGQLAFMHSDFEDLGSNQLSYKFFTQDKVGEFEVELGAKGFWLDTEDDSGFGVALGVGAAIELLPKLFAGASVYYSPDIITGGDFDNSFEVDARLAYQLLENGSLFVGYRRLEADTGRIDIDVYDDAYFGVKFQF